MQVRITDEAFHFGETGEASVIYYDIDHTGNGPDLCLVKIKDKTFQMLSSQFEVIEQSEPLIKYTGYNDKNGNPVYGGQLIADDGAVYLVVWDSRLAEWKLERVSGCYSYPTIQQVRRMLPLAQNAA